MMINNCFFLYRMGMALYRATPVPSPFKLRQWTSFGISTKKAFNSMYYRRQKKGIILPVLAFCENQYLLARYPAPLWILPQSQLSGMAHGA
jgi:hypothetical protein